jgi:glycosyltransferase involved in cell wall biosynthesis
MRILVVAPRIPWPSTDGGRVAMARLATSLALEGAAVEVLSLNPRKHRVTADAPIPLRSIDIDTSRPLASAVRALTSGAPLIVARFVSGRFRDELRAALRRFAPDIVQIESPFMLPYAGTVREASRARVALRSLNVEFRIWEGLARIERRPLRRLALRRVAASLRSYELRELNRLDAVLPISDDDARDFRTFGVRTKMHVVPCGVMPGAGRAEAAEPNTAAFIGSLDFLPNQDAVRWIIDELWPRVRNAFPEARLSIAGSNPPAALVERARGQGIDILANVSDAAAFVRAQSVILAPLFAGGGMRIKVLEAMALGKPVVATTIGAGGIAAEHGRDILIADDVVTFADAVVRLLRDPAAAARTGAAAAETVARRYDSAAIARELIRFYEEL